MGLANRDKWGRASVEKSRTKSVIVTERTADSEIGAE